MRRHRLRWVPLGMKVDLDPHAADTHILVGRDESKTLAFKQTLCFDLRTEKKEKYIEMAVLKTIGAFLNSDGGTLLVGVTDDNEMPGIDSEIATVFSGSNDKFLLHFKNLLANQIGPEFYPLVDQKIVRIDEVEVMRVDVQPASKPCFIGNDFYVRTNPATDRLQGLSLLEYVNQRFSDKH